MKTATASTALFYKYFLSLGALESSVMHNHNASNLHYVGEGCIVTKSIV